MFSHTEDIRVAPSRERGGSTPAAWRLDDPGDGVKLGCGSVMRSAAFSFSNHDTASEASAMALTTAATAQLGTCMPQKPGENGLAGRPCENASSPPSPRRRI